MLHHQAQCARVRGETLGGFESLKRRIQRGEGKWSAGSHVIRLRKAAHRYSRRACYQLRAIDGVRGTFKAAAERLGAPRGMLTQRSTVLMRPYATLELVL